MTPHEYKQIMEGFSYKEHLDCPSDFWHGKPDGCKWVWRYYEKNVGVFHLTDEFWSLNEIDMGKYMYDLRTENKYEDCFIYRRYENGILRITNPKCNEETNLNQRLSYGSDLAGMLIITYCDKCYSSGHHFW